MWAREEYRAVVTALHIIGQENERNGTGQQAPEGWEVI